MPKQIEELKGMYPPFVLSDKINELIEVVNEQSEELDKAYKHIKQLTEAHNQNMREVNERLNLIALTIKPL